MAGVWCREKSLKDRTTSSLNTPPVTDSALGFYDRRGVKLHQAETSCLLGHHFSAGSLNIPLPSLTLHTPPPTSPSPKPLDPPPAYLLNLYLSFTFTTTSLDHLSPPDQCDNLLTGFSEQTQKVNLLPKSFFIVFFKIYRKAF